MEGKLCIFKCTDPFDKFEKFFSPYKHVFYLFSEILSDVECIVNILIAGLLDLSTQQKVVGLDWITRKSSGITKMSVLSARLHSTAHNLLSSLKFLSITHSSRKYTFLGPLFTLLSFRYDHSK